MSSSPLRFFRDSSPGAREPSQFTYRHLSQMASYSTSCPLRVIAHIDLDAFYAQCEMVRLGVPEDKPLAVQQWAGLIAINYPAREYGIGRMTNVQEARKLCPDLIAQHVATWKEGDDKWAYHPDAFSNIATHKVALDPYRMESRKILTLIKAFLPPNLQKVEKASIDEVFLDLSAQVHRSLLERFPELRGPPPNDDPLMRLPRPPIVALDWQANFLVDLDDVETEVDDPDWDDVALLVASEIVRDVRSEIRDRLHYTCSAGLAKNKMLSKLGSAYKKPNQQTVIRSRAVQQFLSDFKFTKIRMLGGKLGEKISSIFGTNTVQGLLPIAVEQLKNKLGDDTGIWVYNTIRGIDTSEVNSRTQIKSMLSAKAFRPDVTSFDQAAKWLRIFSGDIFSRLVDEGVLENKRRPKTIALHHLQGSQTRSRQSSIPQGKTLGEEMLFELSTGLLKQIGAEGNIWPCSHLSMSVSGFEDGVSGNMGIGSFLVKGEAARALKDTHSGFPAWPMDGQDPPAKKRRLDGGGIKRFFAQKDTELSTPPVDAVVGNGGETIDEHGHHIACADDTGHGILNSQEAVEMDTEGGLINPLACSRCPARFVELEELQSHQDWHLAKDLQEEERVNSAFARQSGPPRATIQKGAGASSKRTRGKKLEQGQSRLRFG